MVDIRSLPQRRRRALRKLLLEQLEQRFPLDAANLYATSPSSSVSEVLNCGEVELSWTAENRGDAAQPAAWTSAVFLSTDDVLDLGREFTYEPRDLRLGTKRITLESPLGSGESTNVEQVVRVPCSVAAGDYFLFIVPDQAPAEALHGPTPGVARLPLRVLAPDLEVTSVRAPSNGVLGSEVEITWTIRNASSHPAGGRWYDGVYLSNDPVWDPLTDVMAHPSGGNSTQAGPLAAGASYQETQRFVLPSFAPGERYLLFVADAYRQQGESQETNNVWPVPILLNAPDLVVSEVDAPATAVSNQEIDVSWRVTNIGEFAAEANWYDAVFLSTTPELTDAARQIWYEFEAEDRSLAANASYAQQVSVFLPGVETGRYYLIVQTDVTDRQGETENQNNTRAWPIDVTAPELRLDAFTAPADGAAGGVIEVSWSVANVGTVAALGDWYDVFWLSDDETLDDTDWPAVSIPASSPVPAGSGYDRTESIELPAGSWGDKFLILVANGDRTQGESNFDDNVLVRPIQIAAPDLALRALEVPAAVSSQGTFRVRFEVENVGDGAAHTAWFDTLYLSATPEITDAAEQLWSWYRSDVTPLAPSQSYETTWDIQLTGLAPGTWYLILAVDAWDTLTERDETNNLLVRPIAVDAPDLAIAEAQVPEAAELGGLVPVSWTVENLGAIAQAPWYDAVYLSRDELLDPREDPLLASVPAGAQVPLAAGASYPRSLDVDVPLHVEPGDWFFLFVTDAGAGRVESNETNNIRAVPIHLTIPPLADLAVEEVLVSGPQEPESGLPIDLSWRVRNVGQMPTDRERWLDVIYLSRDATLDLDDPFLAAIEREGVLAAGGEYTLNAQPTLPLDASGDYFLIVQTNANWEVREHFSLRDDNVRSSAAPIRVGRRDDPDLVVQQVTVPEQIRPGQAVLVEWTVSNEGAAAASGPWEDHIQIVAANAPDAPLAIETRRRDTPLAPGASYTASLEFDIPPLADGAYRIVVLTDGTDAVFEGDGDDNNRRASPEMVYVQPNLRPTLVDFPTMVGSGQTVRLTWSTTNDGSAATLTGWRDAVYLTRNPSALILTSPLVEYVHEPLAAGASRSVSVDVEVPPDLEGPWDWVVVADDGAEIHEGLQETDNAATASVTITITPFADLAITDLQAPSELIGDPVSLTVSWTVSNLSGDKSAEGPWVDRLIASADQIPGNFLDQVLGEWVRTEPLAPGASYTRTETVRLPAYFEGRFNLFLITDAADAVFERGQEANNTAMSATPLDVAPRPYADLIVSDLSVPANGASGRPLVIEWTVANQGLTSTDSAAWFDEIWLATDPEGQNRYWDPNRGNPALASIWHQGALAQGGSYQHQHSIRIPDGLEGTYYIVVTTGSLDRTVGQPYEFLHRRNNQRVSGPIEVALTPAPDLSVRDIQAPSQAFAGETIDVRWTVRNVGTGAAEGAWIDRFYLRPTVENGLPIQLGTFPFVAGLAPGIQYERLEQVRLPNRIQGQFELIVETNWNGDLYEQGNFDNNRGSAPQPVLLQLTAKPNLQVAEITGPAQIAAGGTASFEFVVLNQGTQATGPATWADKVYLSLDDRVSQDDLVVATLAPGSALAPGESYRTVTPAVTIPNRLRGDAYLIVQTDGAQQLDEYPFESDNVRVFPLTVEPLPAADLVVQDVRATSQALEGSEIEVRFRVRNLGVGTTDQAQWTDTIWLTRDRNRPHPGTQHDPQDVLLATLPHDGTLAVGEDYEVVATVRLPERVSGEWFITPWTDVHDVVLEEVLDSNVNPDDPTEFDNNNYRARPITIVQAPVADLAATNLEVLAFNADRLLTVRWTAVNIGAIGTETENWRDHVYLSDRPDVHDPQARVWRLTDSFTGAHDGALERGEAYSQTLTFTIGPHVAGNYLVVDVGEGVWEGPFKANNVAHLEFPILAAASDLQIVELRHDVTTDSGELLRVSWTVQNLGLPVWSGTEYWHDLVYISPDPEWDPNRATLLGTVRYDHLSPLGTNATYTQTAEFLIPEGIDGDRYLYVVSDPFLLHNFGATEQVIDFHRYAVFEGARCLPECDPGNEVNVSPPSPLEVVYREPDLQVTQVNLPASSLRSGQLVPVAWEVANLGERATRSGLWIDRIYLSRDPALDSQDLLLGTWPPTPIRPGASRALEPGESSPQTIDVRLPYDAEGDYYLLVVADSNFAYDSNLQALVAEGGPSSMWDVAVDSRMAREREYRDEGNNLRATPIHVELVPPPDLQVTSIAAPVRVQRSGYFDVTYEVANRGVGATPPDQSTWRDYLYLSRDAVLDLATDRFLGEHAHSGELASGASYQVTKRLQVPADLLGTYYLFVVTDPLTPDRGVFGDVFEGTAERNNDAHPAQPLVIELAAPTDLQIEQVNGATAGQTGAPIIISWTGRNAHPVNEARGIWTDSVYLSKDAVWDMGDVLLGRSEVKFEDGLAPGGTYAASLDTSLPALTPGTYHVLVRGDVLDQVFEGPFETNNTTAAAQPIQVTAPRLQLGEPLDWTLAGSHDSLFAVDVPDGQTLRVRILTGADDNAQRELFVRGHEAPTAITHDAASTGRLTANPLVIVPHTVAGTYYVLLRSRHPGAEPKSIQLVAELLPFGVLDITPDAGGDGRWVTTTIVGAGFHPGAVAKLVRPGFAEFEPVAYRVEDATRIVATFDLRQAPHGLYDVQVINPDGQRAILPYRYRVEQAFDPDVVVGLGGPRVLAPGATGLYGITVLNTGNVDAPYVHYAFGLPELGTNPIVHGLRYVSLSSNLSGSPLGGSLGELPWSSLDPIRNQAGELLASGILQGLPAGQFTGNSLAAQTYPGLRELVDREFEAFREKLYQQFPQLIGLLDDGPEGLKQIDPNLYELWRQVGQKTLDPRLCAEIAFPFHVLATATALGPDEYLALQQDEARRLRAAILADAAAPPSLVVLAADERVFVDAYLAALEQTGLLRTWDETPPYVGRPHVISLVATLATGLLAGPAGPALRAGHELEDFFAQVRRWYGPQESQTGNHFPPPASQFDLGLRQPTHYVGLMVYVPYGACRIDIPPGVDTTPLDLSRALDGTARQTAALIGPFGRASGAMLPADESLPFTIAFQSGVATDYRPNEIRVTTQLDSHFDLHTLELGSIQLGELRIDLPPGRGAFQGDFDYRDRLGIVVRVNAGLDLARGIVTWQLQAIDPETGEPVRDSQRGLLAAVNAQGAGDGQISYRITPRDQLPTGTTILARARVQIAGQPPQDTNTLAYTLDSQAPVTTVTAEPLGQRGSIEVRWSAQDNAQGSGVRHVTIYVSENGGPFRIWQRQTTETSAIFTGDPARQYEFLGIATDHAGNRGTPQRDRAIPDDGSRPERVSPNADPIWIPIAPPETNPEQGTPHPLFVQAQSGVPAPNPTTRLSEFSTVLLPFRAEAFVRHVPPSTSGFGLAAGIGPLAIAERDDGMFVLSGGAARNQLYLIPRGGADVVTPWVELPYPIFDLAFDPRGFLWAATGGGPLLQLDAHTGRIVGQFGEGISQAVQLEPGSGRIFVSSRRGIEQFDPASGQFELYSAVRVGSLAFDTEGTLWAASWPRRGEVLRFDPQRRPEQMFQFESPVDSLAFGRTGTALEGLLFVSHNAGELAGEPSRLTMIDVATRQQVALAAGGSRGDIVETTSDGRVLLSQSRQVDLLTPALAPRVAATSPPADGIVALPRGFLTLAFDQPMLEVASVAGRAVTDPRSYRLVGERSGTVPIREVRYDGPTRTATLLVEGLGSDRYVLELAPTLRSEGGIPLSGPRRFGFTAVTDLSPFVDLQFSRTRWLRSEGTVSYDVTVTNRSAAFLSLPLLLVLDPARGAAVPREATLDTDNQLYLIDLSASLPNGTLAPGASTTARTIGLDTATNQTLHLQHRLGVLASDNQVPRFLSESLPTARIGVAWEFILAANDPEGDAVEYELVEGPAGMTLERSTGRLNWTPAVGAAWETRLVIQARDSQGATSVFRATVTVESGNQPPKFSPIAAEHRVQEDSQLEFPLQATDPDGDPLIYWLTGLPPGAELFVEPALQGGHARAVFRWRTGFQAAGVYPVQFSVSDGRLQDTVVSTITVVPVNQPPVLELPALLEIEEGQRLRFRLTARDPDGDELEFFATRLPPGAMLDRTQGWFEWIPAYYQAGRHEVTFTASDGQNFVRATVAIDVANVNAPPVFASNHTWQVAEGQPIALQMLAIDPDNPAYLPTPTLSPEINIPDESPRPSVRYEVSGLPPGAQFSETTGLLQWVPPYDAAGQYRLTVRAIDDGDGTELPLATEATFEIVVVDVNRPPDFPSLDPISIARGTTRDVALRAEDPDGDPITLRASGTAGQTLPDFITFSDLGNGNGQLRLQPGTTRRGDYPIVVTATDDGGGYTPGRTTQRTINVQVTSLNEPPNLEPIGHRVAVPGTPLTIELRAQDADQEPLEFIVEPLPHGATLVPGTTYGSANFTWHPQAGDLGQRSVTVRVRDSGNGDPQRMLEDAQTITLTVRGENAAPRLGELVDQVATELDELSFRLPASDPDGDSLLFAATNLPPGAAFDPMQGQFRWTPTLFQAGIHGPIGFSVTDGNLADSRELWIEVRNLNQPPRVVPLPVQRTREGTALSFTVAATDLDGDAVAMTAANLPPGARFLPRQQRFEWTPNFEQAGTYTVLFQVTDPWNATGQQEVVIVVDNVNRPPVFEVRNRVVAVGETLSTFLAASDPDSGDLLRYSALGLPPGAVVVDTTGELRWTPASGDLGDHVVQFSVTDGTHEVSRSAVLRATVEAPRPPVEILVTPSFPVMPGDAVYVRVLGGDFVALQQVALELDGQPVTLDAQHRAVLRAAAPGRYQLTASVTDMDGRTNVRTVPLQVRDAGDLAAPSVSVDATLRDRIVRSATPISIHVFDQQLDWWRLEISPRGRDAFVTLAEGDSSFSGVAATLEPAAWRNGFYQLRLTASDLAGRRAVQDLPLEISSLVGQETLHQVRSEDLVVELDGQTITLARIYDDRNRTDGLFGHAWGLAGFEFQLETADLLGNRETLANLAWRQGERLYLDLPDGRRAGFTFSPREIQTGASSWWRPAWEADPGIEFTLDSRHVLLRRVGARYHEIGSDLPYNLSTLGRESGAFTLTAPGGTRYELDPQGRLRTLVSANGKAFVAGDGSLVAPSGARLTWTTDSANRIQTLTAPDGRRVDYQYDNAGNLTYARLNGTDWHRRYGYRSDASRQLIWLMSPEGPPVWRDSAASEEGTRLTSGPHPLLRLASQSIEGELASGATDRHLFAVRDSELEGLASSRLLLRVQVSSSGGGNIRPTVPSVTGATLLETYVSANSVTSLFAIERAGLYALELSANSGAGAYQVEIHAAGDANRDGRIDLVDSHLVAAALGKVAGSDGYLSEFDVNGDGLIDARDQRLVASNFGWRANRAPSLASVELLTHAGLPVREQLTTYATDPERDRFFFEILGSAQGEAVPGPGGRSVVFRPTPGFHGTATIQVRVDDGYSSSELIEIPVQVSDARLVKLELVNELPHDRLSREVGEVFQQLVLGSFADEPYVLLPPGYVQLESSDPSVLTVRDGIVRTHADGVATLTATAGGLRAVLPIAVGIPRELDAQLLLLSPLQVYPSSVSLAPGQSRQLLVGIAGLYRLGEHISGTQYLVENPEVLEVSPEGLVTAKSAGQSAVTVILGPSHTQVQVNVVEPVLSPAEIGRKGGIVMSRELQVQIPAGALATESVVAVTPIEDHDLPVPLPDWLEFATAFRLELDHDHDQHDHSGQAHGEGVHGRAAASDGKQTAAPIQLTLPAPAGAQPGTKALIYQQATFEVDGQERSIWLQVDAGVVGDDGLIRTTSPPYEGIKVSEAYMIGVPAQNVRTGLVEGELKASIGDSHDLGLFKMIVSGFTGAVARFTGGFVIDLPVGRQAAEVIAVPRVGSAVSTAGYEIEVQPSGRSVFEAVVDGPSAAELLPQIHALSVRLLAGAAPTVVIQGTNFGSPDQAELVVETQRLDGQSVRLTVADWTPTEIAIPWPNTIPLGRATVRVERTTTSPTHQTFIDTSNTLRFSNTPNYAFVALGGDDALAVFCTADSLPPGPRPDFQSHHQVIAHCQANDGNTAGPPAPLHRIPLTAPGAERSRPHGIVLTADNALALLTLRAAGAVAVVDAIALQQIDVMPGTFGRPNSNGYQNIQLPPGAEPYEIVLGADQKRAFVSDFRQGAIYVLDLNPFSPTFLTHVETLTVPAPYGLRDLVITPDGRQLVAAAPNGRPMFSLVSETQRAQLIVYDLHRGDIVQRIDVGDHPFDLQTSLDAAGRQVIAFTDLLNDQNGFGVIRRNAGETRWSEPRFVAMRLGPSTDSFDVNNARSLVVLPDQSLAFVAGYNIPIYPDIVSVGSLPLGRISLPSSDHFFRHESDHPAGSNLGIIADPFGDNPRLVGATRPIPAGFPLGLQVSPDGSQLYASFSTVPVQGAPGSPPALGAIFAYDVAAIKVELERARGNMTGLFDIPPLTPVLQAHPINDLVQGQYTKGTTNQEIDVRAGLIYDLTANQFVVTDPNRAPIGIGGIPGQIVFSQAETCSAQPIQVPVGVKQHVRWNGSNPDVAWSMDLEVTPDDGVVLTNVYLGARRMAERISVPYFVLKTGDFSETRLELTPDGDHPVRGNDEQGQDLSGRSRLVELTIDEQAFDNQDGLHLLIRARYLVDRINERLAPRSCLYVTQEYHFYPERDPAQKLLLDRNIRELADHTRDVSRNAGEGLAQLDNLLEEFDHLIPLDQRANIHAARLALRKAAESFHEIEKLAEKISGYARDVERTQADIFVPLIRRINEFIVAANEQLPLAQRSLESLKRFVSPLLPPLPRTLLSLASLPNSLAQLPERQMTIAADTTACEPTGELTCAKFRPVVRYSFLPGTPSEAAPDQFEIRIPQRIHYDVTGPARAQIPNSTLLTHDTEFFGDLADAAYAPMRDLLQAALRCDLPEPPRDKPFKELIAAVIGVEGLITRATTGEHKLSPFVIPAWGGPGVGAYCGLGYTPDNPLRYEVFDHVLVDGVPVTSRGPSGLNIDNFHQTYQSYVTIPLDVPPYEFFGQPEGIHMHWRWNHIVRPGGISAEMIDALAAAFDLGGRVLFDGPSLPSPTGRLLANQVAAFVDWDFPPQFGSGAPLIPIGSKQSLNLAVVAYHAEEVDPIGGFESLVLPGNYQDGESLVGQRPVFWWEASSRAPTDIFFWSGGSYASEVSMRSAGVRGFDSNYVIATQHEDASGEAESAWFDFASSPARLSPTTPQGESEGGPVAPFTTNSSGEPTVRNGDFEFDVDSPEFGWQIQGTVGVESGVAVLRENAQQFSRLVQTIVIPSGATVLEFTLRSVALHANPGGPPDAFEVALVDPTSGLPLRAPITDLSASDALLNIQAGGEMLLSPHARIEETPSSRVVSVDLRGLNGNQAAILSFDLLSVGAPNGEVRLDRVAIRTCGGHNPLRPTDVTDDGVVAPIDVLLIINDINDRGGGPLLDEQLNTPPYLDVNCDNVVAPIDALLVINWINDRLAAGEGEAEILNAESAAARNAEVHDGATEPSSAAQAATDRVFATWELAAAAHENATRRGAPKPWPIARGT